MPRVSVCVPVYNPGPYLVPAVESILGQHYDDFEVIVVDDCSQDPVERIIGDLADKRISFYSNRQNLGLVANWNRCISLAEGRYITLFHQDDVMHPDNLRCKVEALDANPNAGFVYSNIQRIDAVGTTIGGHWIPQPEKDAVFSGEQIFRMIASSGNPISCPSVVVRQMCYQRFGTFDERLRFAVDLEMWMRIAIHHDVIYLADPLIYQRVHPEQETAHFQGTGRDYQDVLRVLDILQSQPLPRDLLISVVSAYRILGNRAFRMARWKLWQGEISSGLCYSLVALAAFHRSIFTAL